MFFSSNKVWYIKPSSEMCSLILSNSGWSWVTIYIYCSGAYYSLSLSLSNLWLPPQKVKYVIVIIYNKLINFNGPPVHIQMSPSFYTDALLSLVVSDVLCQASTSSMVSSDPMLSFDPMLGSLPYITPRPLQFWKHMSYYPSMRQLSYLT